MNTLKKLARTWLALLALTFSLNIAVANEKVKPSGRTVVAEVVAFDQAFMLNRLGSALKTPRIFALRKDVMRQEDGKPLLGYKEDRELRGLAGKVCLKEYKRARPIVLRANVGDILEIRFTNLLNPTDPTTDPPNQPTGQFAGCHVMGLSLAASVDDDSSWVGQNNLTGGATPNPLGGSFAPNAGGPTPTPTPIPGVTPTPTPAATATLGDSSRVYRYLVDAEGVFILYSAADPTGNNGPLNEGGNGLFGCVIVQPPNAEYYRSQVLRTDLIDATYDTQKLPVNMVLHLKPKPPKRPNEPEDGDHWLLTTYKTRLHDFVLKEVEVEIVPDDEVQAQTAASQPKEEARSAAAPSKKQAQNFMRDLKTGEALAEAAPPSDSPELRKLQEEGKAAPPGKLYAASTKHPLIDYPVAYSVARARPAGWPVLEMLYPEATKLLSAQKDNSTLSIAKDDAVFTLRPGSKNPDPQDNYASAITQLDTGTVPRELWPVLNAWGIKEMPDVTRVAPQRDYFDLTLDQKKRIPRKGTANFIWLLTGVELAGKKNSAVIIHGDVKDLTLRFLEVELQLFHSDLTAIITGPRAEGFGNMQNSPSAFLIPASPERAQPYREFALGYHNGGLVNQAFAQQRSPSPLASVTNNGNDNFGINYGMAGIATEILASRLGVGPEGFNRLGDGQTGGNNDGVDLKFEEFFLSSWAVGDPAMLVDRPANGLDGLRACPPPATPTPSPAATPVRATKVFYPDDPSNVYHSYMRDHVKMRIYNAGENAPHVHHLHAHQWLRSPNSDEASYLDSQLIVPGSAFSLEITYNGSGNRNQTVGDSIFHCHFYPHFAQGMWSLWRVHDVFEDGTPLDKDGKVASVSGDPAKWVRALPDAEIETGTPIPAIVPLPTLAMPPLPPPVRVTKIPDLPANPAGGAASVNDLKKWVNISKDGANPSLGRMVQVKPDVGMDGKTVFGKDGKPVFSNPGFPFFVPGVAGHRPPHPPLDMAWKEKEEKDKTGAKVRVPDLDSKGEKKYLDGGLPRHQVLGGQIVREFHTPWDFTKDYVRYDEHEKPVDGAMVAYRIPEDGTPIEKAAMEAHRTRTVKTVEPDGRPGNFIRNGLPPTNGAPFADPGVDDEGNAVRSLRKYKAAVIQKDVIFNKAGWHYPQQRFLTLWQDVKPTFDEKRPAQPFFFRANSGETVEYWHTNLVPEYYELDDFQVRTPTDIIGQHIHLVKFDVLASDGAVNGFNYEDGTISPDDVRGRIHAITRPFSKPGGAKYSLFEMSQLEPGNENYVAGIDWSNFVAATPIPVPWEKSYLRQEMSQGLPEEKWLMPPAGQNWDGAMTTIQRFSTDPLLNNQGIDRTVRTVFTHDHFGPSTHQQAGLYAGFLVEPENSVWRDPVTGGLLYDPVTRSDGGPTGWEAIIEPQDTAESYREFAVEFQDLQLAYTNAGGKKLAPVSGAGSVAAPSFGAIAVPVFVLPTPTTPALVNKFPVGPPLTGCTTTKDSTTVTCASTQGLLGGMTIKGPNIPLTASVSSITNSTTFVMTIAATGAGTKLSLAAQPTTVNLTGCTTTKDAATVTCASTQGLLGGMTISGPNIPPTASVSSITNGATFVMTIPATGAGTDLSLTAPPIPLSSFLVANGISLTPAAVFVFPKDASGTVGIVDDGDQSVYKYPANTAAFGLQQDVMNAQLLLKPLHLETWSFPNTAIKPPGAPQIISSGNLGTYSVNYRSEPLSPGRVTPLLLADCATQGGATVICADTAGLLPGMSISGTVISSKAFVTGVTNATTFVMSNAAMATGSNLSLTAETKSSTKVLLSGCRTTKGSTTVTCASTAKLLPGMIISDAVIPSPASISSVTNGTTFVMTAAATGKVSGLSLTAQPIPSVALTGCATTKGSATVTCASTAGLFPGMSIAGANIPPAASVGSITNPTTFVMSAAAIDSGSKLLLTAIATPSLTRDDMALAFASIERGAPWNLDRPDTKVASADGKAPPLFARPVDPGHLNGLWEDPVKFAKGTDGVNDGKISNWDPYTPLLRGYQGDPVQVRALVGAHTQPHSFTINGVKWLGEMKSKNSGLRDAQEMGISEHFEFEFTLPPASTDSSTMFADYLYAPSSGSTGQANGVWGLLRSYDNPPQVNGESVDAPIASLRRLPKAANERPYTPSHAPIVVSHPATPDVEFTLSARSHQIDYNSANAGFLNKNGMVYTVDKVRANNGGSLQDQNVSTKPGDPLILRVNAGAWVKIILNNLIPAAGQTASTTVGLHPQLVAYDIRSGDGAAVGFNPKNQVITPGDKAREYWWYAGDLEMEKSGEISSNSEIAETRIVQHARELGAVNLCPAAPLNQDANGLLGALIVEPAGAIWTSKDYVTQAADILDGQGHLLFRDFVLIEQANLALNAGNIPNSLADNVSAVNNRSADLGFRLSGIPTPTPAATPSPVPVWQVLSNSLPGVPVGGPPNTPIFTARVGDRVRFRVLQPGGDSIGGNIMFEIHGHSWQQEPWIKSSSVLGDNPNSNVLGADILVPHKALNILIDRAGGPNGVPGDYLYYNFLAGDGAWGIFRVCDTDDCLKNNCVTKD